MRATSDSAAAVKRSAWLTMLAGFCCSAAGISAQTPLTAEESLPLPTSGTAVAALAPFDEAMQRFMRGRPEYGRAVQSAHRPVGIRLFRDSQILGEGRGTNHVAVNKASSPVRTSEDAMNYGKSQCCLVSAGRPHYEIEQRQNTGERGGHIGQGGSIENLRNYRFFFE